MAKRKSDPASYENALSELEAIVYSLQESNVQIDVLSAKAKRAAMLIKYCRQKLRSTEKELNDLFEEDD
ncbi:MAG: exodeoxyribonuclease VII small subunit [Bacteroidota bacterium]